MLKHTPFYNLHLDANAKMVDFAGWEMPLHYGSQLEEHHLVRHSAGMFDVSHMGILDIKGPDTEAFLRLLLANNIDTLVSGKALYTCMLNEQGGVIDDLIVYKIQADFYRLVVNAGTRVKDIAWLRQHATAFKLEIIERHDLAMLAIQGPDVKNKITACLPATLQIQITELKPFHFAMHAEYFIARTGYTGEDGFELIFPKSDAQKIWQALIASDIKPCGLGARDTLRLEAGLNLYGADMDETVSPLEANLAWTIALTPTTRHFIGRNAIEEQKKIGVQHKLVGLVLAGPGIIRNHQKIRIDDVEAGIVTSGGYSPTLEKSIALARVLVTIGDHCMVEIRNKYIPAQVVKPAFVRHGKKLI